MIKLENKADISPNVTQKIPGIAGMQKEKCQLRTKKMVLAFSILGCSWLAG